MLQIHIFLFFTLGTDVDVDEHIVLIAAVSGAVLLIVVVFTIVLVAVCTYKRKSKWQKLIIRILL